MFRIRILGSGQWITGPYRILLSQSVKKPTKKIFFLVFCLLGSVGKFTSYVFKDSKSLRIHKNS